MIPELQGDEIDKKTCYNCGKRLGVLDGYCHPTLGKGILLCWGCYESVWDSVVRWERFIAWNSFDPDTPDPTFIDNFPFPYQERLMRHKKIKHQRPLHVVIP